MSENRNAEAPGGLECQQDKWIHIAICSQGCEGWRCSMAPELPGTRFEPEGGSGHYVIPGADVYKQVETLKEYKKQFASLIRLKLPGVSKNPQDMLALKSCHVWDLFDGTMKDSQVSGNFEHDRGTTFGLSYFAPLDKLVEHGTATDKA